MSLRELQLFKELEAVKRTANDLAQDAARWHTVRDGSRELLNNLMHTSNAEYRVAIVDTTRVG